VAFLHGVLAKVGIFWWCFCGFFVVNCGDFVVAGGALFGFKKNANFANYFSS